MSKENLFFVFKNIFNITEIIFSYVKIYLICSFSLHFFFSSTSLKCFEKSNRVNGAIWWLMFLETCKQDGNYFSSWDETSFIIFDHCVRDTCTLQVKQPLKKMHRHTLGF